MKKRLALGVVFVASACGADESQKQNIDYDLKPHTDWFLQICQESGDEFNKSRCARFQGYIPEMIFVKQFASGPDRTMGRCYPQTRRIEFRRDYWQTLSTIERRQLVAHELAHCLLSKNHKEHGLMAALFIPATAEYLEQIVRDEVKESY